MKLNFSLENKEASLEADVEKLIEKGMDQRVGKPERKTRYQIRQEEKRKRLELIHKQKMKMIFIGIGLFLMIMMIILVMILLEGQGVV